MLTETLIGAIMFAWKPNTTTSMWNSTQGGEIMGMKEMKEMKELNKMLEKLPEKGIEILGFAAKAMLLMQKAQQGKHDDEKSA